MLSMGYGEAALSITLKELNPNDVLLTPEQEDNLRRHYNNLQKFRAAYGKPMTVTSGVRTPDRQAQIDALAGRQPRLASRHIAGDATDFADHDGSLAKFCLQNLHLLESCGLFIESPEYTPGWTHLQSAPPKSGRRVFLPYAGNPPVKKDKV
jgi:hypothetical protein